MTSAPDAAFHIDVSAAQATVNLNLKAILMRMGGRAIRTLSTEGLHLEVHPQQPGWNIADRKRLGDFAKVAPRQSRDFGRFDLRVEDGPTVILLRAFLFRERSRCRPLQRGRSHNCIAVVSPNFLATARRNKMGG